MALSFDKIGGRISEAAAVANADIDEKKILAFYKKTLVQMGWLNRSTSNGDDIVFSREGESLAISIESLEGDAPAGKLVKFTLKPQ